MLWGRMEARLSQAAIVSAGNQDTGENQNTARNQDTAGNQDMARLRQSYFVFACVLFCCERMGSNPSDYFGSLKLMMSLCFHSTVEPLIAP